MKKIYICIVLIFILLHFRPNTVYGNNRFFKKNNIDVYSYNSDSIRNPNAFYLINSDSILYSISLEYILNSGLLSEKFNYLFDNEDFKYSCVYISPEIISLELRLFGEEIIDNEFPEFNEETKQKVYALIDDCELKVIRTNKLLVNKYSGTNLKLIIFLSIIKNNKMTARIKVYDEFYGKKFCNYYAGPHRNALVFLFNFTNTNKIDKVFLKYITD